MKFTIRIDEHTYEVEVGELNTRPVVAVVDGESFEVYPQEAQPESAPAAQRQDAPPAPAPVRPCGPPPPVTTGAGDAKAVLAPIPGVIIAVSVETGQKVEYGQELCVLEAMKMKNVIRASRPGVIAAVKIKAGDTVRHGQTLVEFDG